MKFEGLIISLTSKKSYPSKSLLFRFDEHLSKFLKALISLNTVESFNILLALSSSSESGIFGNQIKIQRIFQNQIKILNPI